jgi:hypothetical protein
MTWNLFIDDERFPPDDGREWVIARTYGEALLEVFNRGFPSYISFDHDLGENQKTGHDIAKQLVDNDMISGDRESRAAYKFAPDFGFYVHSQNPIGKANIEGLLNNYLNFKNTQGAK